MCIAASQRLGDERFDWNRTVARHRATRQRAVAQHVVAELDELGSWQCPLHHCLEIALRPAVEQLDADAEPAHLGQGDGIAKGVGEMNVGVEARRVLDRQRHARPLRVLHAGCDHGAEAIGGLLPGQCAPTPGQHVDHARPYRGRGVDHRQQRVARHLCAGVQPAITEDVADRLNRIVVALQKLWKLRIKDLAVQDAQPRHPQRRPVGLQRGQRLAVEGDAVHRQPFVRRRHVSRGSRSRRRIAHGRAGIRRAAHRGLRRCRSAVASSSGICRIGRRGCWPGSRAWRIRLRA